jgi:hypothetical protein
MVLEIFGQKGGEKLAILTQNSAIYSCRKFEHNIGLQENRQFFR